MSPSSSVGAFLSRLGLRISKVKDRTMTTFVDFCCFVSPDGCGSFMNLDNKGNNQGKVLALVMKQVIKFSLTILKGF